MGVLIFIGPTGESLGRFYAECTGREFVRVSLVAEISKIPKVEMIVGLSNVLSEIADWILINPDIVMPGIIVADTLEKLEHRLKASLRLLRSHRHFKHSIIECDVNLETEIVEFERHIIIGSKAEAQSTKSIFANCSARLITITGHSDGVDTMITHNLAACPLIGRYRDDNELGGRSPRCILTGHCHRRNRTVSEAIKSGTLLSPDALSTAVIFYNVCDGLMLDQGSVNPRWGLGWRLINNARIGAIITSLGKILRPENIARQLISLLDDGLSVGDSVRQINKKLYMANHGYRLFILGEPLLRIADRVSSTARCHQSFKITTNSSSLPTAAPINVSFLSDLADSILSQDEAYLSSAVSSAAKELFKKNCEFYRPSTEPLIFNELLLSALNFCIARGRLYDDWVDRFDGFRTARTHECIMCSRPSTTYVFYPASSKLAGARRLSVCATCGVVEDASIQTDWRARIDNGVIVLTGASQLLPVGIGALIRSSCEQEKVSLIKIFNDWPTGQTLDLDISKVQGPLRIQCFIVNKFSVNAFGRQLHRDDLLTGDAELLRLIINPPK